MMALRFGLAAAVLAAVGGCTPALPGVTGTVTLDGQPVGDAIVRFYQPGDPASAMPVFFTVTRPDGTFDIPAGDNSRAGPPVGRFAVAVVKYKDKPVMGMPREKVAALKSLLPAAYADPAASGLTADLKGGANPVELKLEVGRK